MFVGSLKDVEKQALLKALWSLARIDGVLSDGEVTFISGVAAELGVDADSVLQGEDEDSLEEILGPISEPRDRRAVVLEFIHLAHADESFSLDELVVIEEIATVIFGIDEPTLEAIKDWVVKDIEWKKAGLELVENGVISRDDPG